MSDVSKRVAEAIQKHVVSKTGAKNGGVRTNTKFTTLRKTVAPSLVIECGYMSNMAECGRLRDPLYQELVVDGIVAGVQEALAAG